VRIAVKNGETPDVVADNEVANLAPFGGVGAPMIFTFTGGSPTTIGTGVGGVAAVATSTGSGGFARPAGKVGVMDEAVIVGRGAIVI
jgi:hypothetical protein